MNVLELELCAVGCLKIVLQFRDCPLARTVRLRGLVPSSLFYKPLQIYIICRRGVKMIFLCQIKFSKSFLDSLGRVRCKLYSDFSERTLAGLEGKWLGSFLVTEALCDVFPSVLRQSTECSLWSLLILGRLWLSGGGRERERLCRHSQGFQPKQSRVYILGHKHSIFSVFLH